MTTIISVSLIIIVLVLDYTSAIPAKRVVGGHVLEYGSCPFLVSMHYLRPNIFSNKTNIQHLCGGSLIGPEWVLTAAHCFSDLVLAGMSNKDNWKIVVGEYNQYLEDAGEQTLQIAKIYSHPNFTVDPLLNDIALLRLDQPVNLTSYVDLIDVYEGEDFPRQKECQVAGWGQVASDPLGWLMYVPLETTVFIVNNKYCRRRYKAIDSVEVDSTILCAGNTKIGKTDACQGDSGGPMVCLSEKDNVRYLVGIVSTGEGCGLAKYPGVYTSVSDFTTWINNTITTACDTSLEVNDFTEATTEIQPME